VPQIIKNYREQSCEGQWNMVQASTLDTSANKLTGLALLFFILSLTGNLTYGVSVIAYSQQKRYLLNALPFLIGSLGTIVEDSIIFVQFRLYSGNTKTTTATE
jgi:solute carrier family 66 (lysosomal lysine-arginine transporter), member 1